MKETGTVLTVFGKYLWDNRISDAKFAAMFSKHLKEQGLLAGDEEFSKRTVEKWRYGKRVPNSVNMKAIKELTGVDPNSWFEEPNAQNDRSG